MQITSENFIEAIKHQDEDALKYILDEYGWIIKTVIKRHLTHLESCQEECMNDVLMGIWLNIERFDPDKSTFKNWVAGIARYKALNYVRKYLKELEYEDINPIQQVEEEGIDVELTKNELSENITQMLNCLKPKDRELFIKLYVEEQTVSEVSHEIGVKPDTIYNRLSRAKKHLRVLFHH